MRSILAPSIEANSLAFADDIGAIVVLEINFIASGEFTKGGERESFLMAFYKKAGEAKAVCVRSQLQNRMNMSTNIQRRTMTNLRFMAQ